MDVCIYFFSKSTQPSPLLAFLLCYVTNMYSEYRFRELFPSRCKYREKTIVVFIYIYIYIYICVRRVRLLTDGDPSPGQKFFRSFHDSRPPVALCSAAAVKTMTTRNLKILPTGRLGGGSAR